MFNYERKRKKCSRLQLLAGIVSTKLRRQHYYAPKAAIKSRMIEGFDFKLEKTN